MALQHYLIGRWSLVKLLLGGHEMPAYDPLTMTLASDGTAKFDYSPEEEASWEVVDDTHFSIRLIIPPDPESDMLPEGAIDVETYEVVSRDTNHMVLRTFDIESDLVYKRT